MFRHTTFRFCLDPTVEQQQALARHAGAARFAFNQCLQTVKAGLTHRKTDASIDVPWTAFDLINVFNTWKQSEDAGRVFAIDATGEADVVVTGLPWRAEVCQQVFEEAAVDCGRALAAWSDSRSGKRKGKKVGFPRFKKKTGVVPSFRLRTKHPKGRLPDIRVGDNHRRRSVTLPRIGTVRVYDDTRRLRRMITKKRAKISYATVSRHAGRWWVCAQRASRWPTCRPPPPATCGWGSPRLGRCRSGLDGVPGRRHSRWPRSRTHHRCAQGAGRRDETPTTAGEIIVTQAERIPSPPQGRSQARPSPLLRRQRTTTFPAPGIQRIGQDPRPARDRRPERVGNASQPPPGPSHLRRGLGRVRPTAGLQTSLARGHPPGR